MKEKGVDSYCQITKRKKEKRLEKEEKDDEKPWKTFTGTTGIFIR